MLHAVRRGIVIPSMKPTLILVIGASLVLCALLFGDGPPGATTSTASPWEVKALMPREVSPARYVQVPSSDLERLAADGWQLVSVTPYVILNEERGPEGRKIAVTQTYPAYFFQRPKPARIR